MVTAGEFVETLMLLGNGVVLTLVGKVMHFSAFVSTWSIPVAFFLGEFLGSILSGLIGDRLGRKKVFTYDLLLFGVGMLAAGFMNSAALIAIFVALAGVGVGGEFPIVDTYTAEMVPRRVRGQSMARVYTIAVLAAPVIAALAYWVSHPSAGPNSWRTLFWIMGVCGLIVWVIRFRVPESPRWQELHGQEQAADAQLDAIEARVQRELGLDALPPVKDEIAAASSKDGGHRYSDIFASDMRSRTLMMLVFQFFQSGLFYGFTTLAPTILEHKGITLVKSLEFSMIIYAGYFVGSIVSMFTIDRVERKWGLIVTAVLAGIFGTLFGLIASETAAVIFGFITTFFLWQFSNFQHTYQAEIFPTRVRTTAAGTTYSVSRISTTIFVLLITNVFLPWGIGATFALIWLLIAVVVFDIGLFGPKTSGLSVDEIAG